MKLYRISGKWYQKISQVRGVRRILRLEQRERVIVNNQGTLDETAYVIRWMNGSAIGLFGMFRFVMAHLKYADENGWIPIVDWRNFDNAYLSTDKIGGVNAWNYYFNDLNTYSLDGIGDFKRIVVSGSETPQIVPYGVNEANLALVRKYISFSDPVQKRIRIEVQKIKSEHGANCRILGLKLRGTDYVATKPYLHSVQPTVQQAISIIRDCIREWGDYDVCFLATEDSGIVQQMKAEFGNWIYLMEDVVRLQSDETWHEDEKLNENRRKAGEDYCVEVGLLAECDALIASGSQGTTVARLLNQNRYEHCYEIDLGTY